MPFGLLSLLRSVARGGTEHEARGSLILVFIYGVIFAAVWFLLFVMVLSRGIVG